VRVGFDDCVVDTDRRELTKAGAPVPLQPKAFRLLEVLVERWPRAVSQEELRGLLWPDMRAGGTRVARIVNEVRKALGDDRKPHRLIRTVHRFGYAFCGTALEQLSGAPASPVRRCAVQWGIQQVPLGPGENVIGRAADALINVASLKVSRRHARILIDGGRAVLEDLGSRNGTYVDERRIEGPVELRGGEHITVGPVLLIFRNPGSDEAESTG
jgi:DNA-binding winged helix-turn-helix (wHTH) protein